MRNWSTDTTRLDKTSDNYKKWRLEQLINFGLGNEKIGREELKRFLPELVLDPAKKKFINFLLTNA